MGEVFLQIDKILECFLRIEFETKGTQLILNRYNPIGKFISSHIRWIKEKPKIKEGSISIKVPDSPHLHMEYYYGYLTRDAEKSIIDYVQAKFDLQVESFFVHGRNLEIDQKDIISIIMNYYKIPISSNIYEMLKKRDYRSRKKILKLKVELIKNM